MKLLVVVFALAAIVKAASVDTLNEDTFDVSAVLLKPF